MIYIRHNFKWKWKPDIRWNLITFYKIYEKTLQNFIFVLKTILNFYSHIVVWLITNETSIIFNTFFMILMITKIVNRLEFNLIFAQLTILSSYILWCIFQFIQFIFKALNLYLLLINHILFLLLILNNLRKICFHNLY